MNSSTMLSFVAGAGCAAATIALAAIPEPRLTTTASTAQPSELAPVLASPPIEQTFSYEAIDLTEEMIQPIPLDVLELFEDYLEIDHSEAAVDLGRMLFHDSRLSTDNSLSCASCHDLRYAGIDRAVTATGIHGQTGQLNTPTIFNAVFNLRQFWDGRASDFEAQADGPPDASGEMGANWNEITAKLIQDGAVMAALAAAYPGEDFSNGVDSSFWIKAIASFESTLVTPNSPFDKYLLGDGDAISEEAKEGYQLFKDLNCTECHNGISIGGKSFQLLGREKPYFPTHDTSGINLGRFNVTGDERDKNAFKVGTLRNVAVTGPWLHDGSQASLEDAVRVMAEFQLGEILTDDEVSRLVSFLNSLTGEYEGRLLDQVQDTVNNRTTDEGN